MSRIKVVIVTLVLLILLLVVGFSLASIVFSRAFEVAVPITPSSPATSTDSSIVRGNATLGALLASSTDPIECSITFTADDERQVGSAFFAEGQVRVDVLVSTTLVESSVANQERGVTWMYDGVTGSTTPQVFNEVLMTSAVAYTCLPWTIDRSVFALPE